MNFDPAAPSAASSPENLLTDSQLAEILNVSIAWVRKQRYLRCKGEKHTLSVDPVRVGSMPRYKAKDINNWLASL
jgi:hypothetical protein